MSIADAPIGVTILGRAAHLCQTGSEPVGIAVLPLRHRRSVQIQEEWTGHDTPRVCRFLEKEQLRALCRLDSVLPQPEQVALRMSSVVSLMGAGISPPPYQEDASFANALLAVHSRATEIQRVRLAELAGILVGDIWASLKGRPGIVTLANTQSTFHRQGRPWCDVEAWLDGCRLLVPMEAWKPSNDEGLISPQGAQAILTALETGVEAWMQGNFVQVGKVMNQLWQLEARYCPWLFHPQSHALLADARLAGARAGVQMGQAPMLFLDFMGDRTAIERAQDIFRDRGWELIGTGLPRNGLRILHDGD